MISAFIVVLGVGSSFMSRVIGVVYPTLKSL